ncbi:alpha/beta hydrolase [Streptomyces sp. NPDC005202]|uniref:alpha/beta fold hydrolase n=1 Tax=Streptomyces sp. NPDC005202 TaxID=3157021 RepID=UPI00339F8BCC
MVRGGVPRVRGLAFGHRRLRSGARPLLLRALGRGGRGARRGCGPPVQRRGRRRLRLGGRLRPARDPLSRFPAPVLVLAGEVDGGPRPELARRAAEVFPNAECAVQPGAGHYPWLDDPEWFVRRVLAFLDPDEVSLPSAE